jgi:hypothetical protein
MLFASLGNTHELENSMRQADVFCNGDTINESDISNAVFEIKPTLSALQNIIDTNTEKGINL